MATHDTPLPRPIVFAALVIIALFLFVVLATGIVASEHSDEEAYLEPVPEPGDYYYEARAADDSWISYINPRDEYRNPYLGRGSGKICVTLLNQDGEQILGTSVPDTSVSIPTGESIAWHSHADPFEVHFPLTQYERPYDADQFGTTPDLPQGDGYLDAHCIEFHGLDENETVTYGEPVLEGEHTDDIDLVGVIQQDGQAWESAIDPVAEAVPYEEAPGGWTMTPDVSHGQVVVVLQLTASGDDESNSTVNETAFEHLEPTLTEERGPGELTESWPLVGWLFPAVALVTVTLLVALARRR